MTDNEAVLRERRERVLLITINRPDQRNAVNAAVARGIADALDELDGDAALSVGVLTGAGKGFSAGMDLKAFVAGESPHVEGRGIGGITQRAAAKPLIAAVEGFAVAGGLELALSCDLIVAARGTRLGIPEVKRSLVAAAGALLRLPRALPRPVAMELALTGDPISAERAYELGLINRLTEPGESVSTALELDWYEDIGLCDEGEAEKLLRSGDTTLGGRIPVNVSGGLASFGEAVPAQALAQVCEVTAT